MLERYDGFWGDKPAAKSIEFISYPEASARMTALITGEVDIINDVPSDAVDTINGTSGVSVVGTSIKNIHIYTFNTRNEDSIMSNQKFRQALTMAIDRQTLVDTLGPDMQRFRMGISLKAMEIYILRTIPVYSMIRKKLVN